MSMTRRSMFGLAALPVVGALPSAAAAPSSVPGPYRELFEVFGRPFPDELKMYLPLSPATVMRAIDELPARERGFALRAWLEGNGG